MDCYLCQHCKAIANLAFDGECEESPSGQHSWISGEEVEGHVQMLWDREATDLTNVPG